MTNIKEYLKGDYIKADEAEKGDVAVIVTEPAIVDSNFKDSVGNLKKALEGQIEFKGEQRMFGWNKTNAKACAKEWGEDTKNWVGKVMVFDKYKQNVSGEMKECLEAKPKEKAQPPKVEKPAWMTEEQIQAKIDDVQGMIGRDAAIQILAKAQEQKA